ncbi:hypothetical protein [Hafnia alvei]|uniref:Molecular chaperone DnaJ n=1 Tax=Hafnia alvei TaxID=569 RepID=A0A1C6YX66_HAFAL|nr:hypothetical protein [Hafnia alvei]SCM51389.1 hypothetical protein BN1044_00851 [Hafnia alvei]
MTKLTKEQVKFFIETMTDDMHNTTQHKIAETLLSKFGECESLQAKLLAYEQAAKNPIGSFHISGGQVEATTDYCRDGEWPVQDGEVLVYAAPVLPKQPELVDLSQQVEILNRILNWILKELPVPTQKASAMAIRLSSVIDIISDLEITAPAQPVIPEQSELRYGDNVLWFLNELAAFDASDIDSDDFDVYGEDRNGMEGCATISITELAADAAKLLSAQPVSEPYKLPQGWKLVPCKLTAENGAKSCMIGEFTEQTEISCPECFGDDECETCDGSGIIEVTVPVRWTTIKDIWSKGIEHFAAAPAQESE